MKNQPHVRAHLLAIIRNIPCPFPGKTGFPKQFIGQVQENAAYFDGLTHVLADDGSLTVGVRVEKDRNAFFHYRKAE